MGGGGGGRGTLPLLPPDPYLCLCCTRLDITNKYVATIVILSYLSTRLTDGTNIAERRSIDVNCDDAFTLQECKSFRLLSTSTSSCSAAANMYAGVKCKSSCELKIHCI